MSEKPKRGTKRFVPVDSLYKRPLYESDYPTTGYAFAIDHFVWVWEGASFD